MSNHIFKFYLQIILFLTIYSQISILSPYNLVEKFNNKKIEMAYGQVGLQSNFYIRGLMYMDTISEGHEACTPLTGLDLKRRNDTIYDENYKILLTYRGTCSFSQKARNAQAAGASMLIVINKGNTPIKNVIFNEESNDIYIPVALINYEDGKIIEDYVKFNPGSKILTEVNFSPLNGNEKKAIDFRLFFSSSEPKAYELIGKIVKYLDKFGDQVVFTPHYVVHQDPYYSKETPRININCFGPYCYFPKETTIVKDGQKILMEDLRQKCMFNYSKKKSLSLYYEYMTTFANECIFNKKTLNEMCSKNTLQTLGYPQNFLDKCVADSFGVNDLYSSSYIEKDNTIFKGEYDAIIKYNLNSFPAVVFDDMKIYGTIKEPTIIVYLCNNVKYKPDFCSTYLKNISKMPSKKVIYFMVFLLVIINICLFFICKKYIIQRINDRVSSGNIDIDSRIHNVINNYFALKNSSNDYKAFDNKNENNSSQVIEMREGNVGTI